MFANPVKGVIHPAVWARPAGNRDFEVTSPFGPRILIIAGVKKASTHKGLDIGNGRAGDNVMAQGGGTVVEYRPNTDGVVTIQSGKWRLVCAHMTSIPVKIGQQVNAGQVIGQVGKVGADIAHLHFENLELVAGKYVARDPWGLLAQNGTLPDSSTEDDMRLKGTLVEWMKDRRATVTVPTGIPIVADPTAQPYNNLKPPTPYPVGAIFDPAVRVKGRSILGSDEWYGAWFAVSPTPVFGYAPVNGCTLAILP